MHSLFKVARMSSDDQNPDSPGRPEGATDERSGSDDTRPVASPRLGQGLPLSRFLQEEAGLPLPTANRLSTIELDERFDALNLGPRLSTPFRRQDPSTSATKEEEAEDTPLLLDDYVEPEEVGWDTDDLDRVLAETEAAFPLSDEAEDAGTPGDEDGPDISSQIDATATDDITEPDIGAPGPPASEPADAPEPAESAEDEAAILAEILKNLKGRQPDPAPEAAGATPPFADDVTRAAALSVPPADSRTYAEAVPDFDLDDDYPDDTEETEEDDQAYADSDGDEPDDPAPRSEADAAAIQAHLTRAVTAHRAGDLGEARRAYLTVMRLVPELPAPWVNMGVMLRQSGHIDAAIVHLRRGVMLAPDDGQAWSNLGNALRSANRLDDAKRAQDRAVDLKPEAPQIHYNLGLAARDLGDTTLAERCFERARLLGYDNPAELAWDRALNTLLRGDLEAGFRGYEARWEMHPHLVRHADLPRWDGVPDRKKTLLVHAEQGLGDTIQFCRYLTRLRGMVGQIVFEVQGPLERLLRQSPAFDGITIIARDAPLPEAHCQIPLLSLPALFPLDEDMLGKGVPYIDAGAGAQGDPPSRANLNVGMVWSGKPSHRNDRNRSIPLTKFMRVLDLPDIAFHSLQVGPAREQIAACHLDPVIIDHTAEIVDFADTARLVSTLDLLITVDTSVAHLAGAMGRPVWLLLPFAPDWRWQLWRNDSPWYPAMTIFRQTSPGDWDDVFARVRAALIRTLRQVEAGRG